MKTIKLVCTMFITTIMAVSCSKEKYPEVPGNSPPYSRYFLNLEFIDSKGNNLVTGIKYNDAEDPFVYLDELTYPFEKEVFKSRSFTTNKNYIVIGVDPNDNPQKIRIRISNPPILDESLRQELQVFQFTSKYIFNDDKPHFLIIRWGYGLGNYSVCKDIEFDGKVYSSIFNTKSCINSVKIVVDR